MKLSVVSGILVFVFGAILGWQRVHGPAEARLGEVTKQLAAERETHRVREQVAGLLRETEEFRKRLAPEPDSAWLVREVGKLAEAAQIELTSIAPQSPKPVQEFTGLAVAVQFSSSYHELGRFLSVIESSYAFIRVDELSIAKDLREHDPDGRPLVKLTLATLHAPAAMLPSGDR